MRILHLATFIQGGAGLAISTLAAEQTRLGHRVDVITSRTGSPGYGNYPEHLDRLANADVALHLVDSLFDRRPLAHAPVARAIDDLGGAGAFDIIHAHAAVPAAIAQAASARTATSTPIVQTMHGWGVAKTPEQTAHDVAVMNHVARLVVPARTAGSHLASLGVATRHLAVVPYGVAPSGEPAPADTHVQALQAWRQAGHLVLCCIGTLGRRKNQAMLLDALALLPADTSVRVAFIGDGPDESLRARAAGLGVAGQVRFCGHQPAARRYLRHADYLVLPSTSEGQPLAILEAFCDGVPVMASRIPELEELVDDGVTGWLFDPTPQALAATMATAARLAGRGRARAMAALARDDYHARFTVARMVDGYLHEYARAS